MMSPTTSSEFERMWLCGSSVCTTTFGSRGSETSTRGEILRRAFVREPDDAPAVLGDLDRHALAHAAEAVAARDARGA